MKIKSLFVLAISSVAFLSACGCSKDRDQDFLNQVNDTLAKSNQVVTCHDAINVLKGNNIDIFNYSFGDIMREFAYDFDTKQFVIMKNDDIVCSPNGYKRNENNFSYFKFTSVYNGNSKYSQYLLDSFEQTEDLIVTTGIDVGDHKDIKNVTYSGSVGVERNIKIRVFCDYLTILADSDNVSYYGNANNVFINDVKTFDLYGATSYVQLRDGTTNFKKGSSTDFLEVPTNYVGEVTATQETDAMIYCAINKPESITAAELSVSEIDNLTDFKTAIGDDAQPFIRLTGDIILDETITLAKNKVIDLNGYLISGTSYGITITSSCYLIDTEYSYNENCKIVLSNSSLTISGYLLMNGGNIEATGNYSAVAVNGGTFEMYGGRINLQSGSSAAAIYLSNNSTVTINYATISTNVTIFENTGATLNVNAGTFTSTSLYFGFDIGGGVTNISGGTFDCENCFNVVNSTNDVELNISGGSFYTKAKYEEGEGVLGSTIAVNNHGNHSCVINIDNAYLYSHYGYIVTVFNNKGTVLVNCNSGTYDYYLGSGTNLLICTEEQVTIKQGGNWINHEYA